MKKNITIIIFSFLLIACKKDKEIWKTVINPYESTELETKQLEPLFLGLNPEMKNHIKDSIANDLLKKGVIKENTIDGYTFVLPINEKNTEFQFIIGAKALLLLNHDSQDFVPSDWELDRTLYQAETTLKWKFESLHDIFESKYQKGKYSDLINNEMGNFITSVFEDKNKIIVISARLVENQGYIYDYKRFKGQTRFVGVYKTEHEKSLDDDYIKGHTIHSFLNIAYYNRDFFDSEFIITLKKNKSEKLEQQERKQDSISNIKNNKDLL
jgi:hypothetical protein